MDSQNKVHPAIIDLGISKQSDKTYNTTLQGMSPYWMPQEYVKDSLISKKTDIWSLGCLFFFIFSG